MLNPPNAKRGVKTAPFPSSNQVNFNDINCRQRGSSNGTITPTALIGTGAAMGVTSAAD